MGLLKGDSRAEYFWSLREVSFSIPGGRTVGVIGHNGAGKSTLLRLLAGIGRPDEGSLEIQGRLSGLLSLGAGFHSDLTGRENVYITGIIAGLTHREVDERFDEIVAFAELPHVIDEPLRTYSSGMQMRLAFSVAIHVKADVLLSDEVLAVGDQAFQRKCLERIEVLKRSGCTIVIVSHDNWALGELCDEIIWLEKGRIRGHGTAADILAAYQQDMIDVARARGEEETWRRTPEECPPLRTASGTVLMAGDNRFGSMEMQIRDLRTFDVDSAPCTEFSPGDTLQVEVEYYTAFTIASPIFTVSISNSAEEVLYQASTDSSDLRLQRVTGSGMLYLQVSPLAVPPGQFFVDVGVYQRDWSYAYDFHWKAYPLRISGPAPATDAQPVINAVWRHRAGPPTAAEPGGG